MPMKFKKAMKANFKKAKLKRAPKTEEKATQTTNPSKNLMAGLVPTETKTQTVEWDPVVTAEAKTTVVWEPSVTAETETTAVEWEPRVVGFFWKNGRLKFKYVMVERAGPIIHHPYLPV